MKKIIDSGLHFITDIVMISINNSCLATILMLQFSLFFPKRNQGGFDVHNSVTALKGVGLG